MKLYIIIIIMIVLFVAGHGGLVTTSTVTVVVTCQPNCDKKCETMKALRTSATGTWRKCD